MLRKILIYLIRGVSILCTKFLTKLESKEISLQKRRVAPWFKANGDKTFRLEYEELNQDSVVFDLGGYEGQWASDIFSKYCSNIFIFEPSKPFSDKIKKRFSSNPKVKVFDFGLSNKTYTTELALAGNASSVFKESNLKEEIELISAMEFFKMHKIEKIDLIKINIEGGEYDLLEYLIYEQLIERFKNIQIQFHDFIPDAVERMKAIQKDLNKTHHLTYHFEFVWENWKIKK